MGSYLNPGNNGFSNMRNDVYVDKTGVGFDMLPHRLFYSENLSS